MNLITDLFDYFTQPWIAALYQEQFSQLLYDIYERGGNMVFKIFDFNFEIFENKKTASSCIPLTAGYAGGT